jgi:carbon-monoxide dehydrogenase medium subunit
MIPAAFDYLRAESLEHAITLLGEHGEDAKLLAGGHSLLPLMKLRLATPAVLVDVGRVPGLSYVRKEGDEIAIGALTRHHDLETDEVLRTNVPLLAKAASAVGAPQVRHRGTIGGSLSHGDPASDLPAAVLALNGTLVATGPEGTRRIPAARFFEGFLQTALAPDEVLTEIRVPAVAGAGWSFQKFTLRAQDWAIVGCAVVRGATTGVALVNMASTTLRAAAVEEALAAGATDEEAAARAAEGAEPTSDISASAEFRSHLARVLVRRALVEAGARAGTFVEIKESRIGERSRVPHLSYVGDAEVGADTNIGAGAITANYRPEIGPGKQRTKIGRNVRTGSDNVFVAPVEIGDNAVVGAGSVVTEDVPPGALAIARARQVNKENYARGERDD